MVDSGGSKMKKMIVIHGLMMGMMILIAVMFLLRFHLPLILLCLAANLLLLGYDLFRAVKTNQLMDFLIRENKQRNKTRVEWDLEEDEKLKMIRRRVEVFALQSQINPHFLYNTLDSIRSKALLDHQKEIASMTEILSKFFRYCISSDESLVKVREEINHINDYYFIQKYRFEDRMNMEIRIEDQEIYELYIPKMTLQPLVENAMIHGLEKQARQGEIIVTVNQTENKMVITISDNGIGMSSDQLDKLNERMKKQLLDAGAKGKRHNGIALTNVNSRIKITFGEEYGIHYRSMEGGGTVAMISLPKIDEFKRVKYENLMEDGR
jgi:two-component system sensor histidine kinase YesM